MPKNAPRQSVQEYFRLRGGLEPEPVAQNKINADELDSWVRNAFKKTRGAEQSAVETLPD